MVRDFENGNLDIYKLNHAIITLIPKIPMARDMKNFRPISLSNCAIKIFSKAMTTRVSPLCDKLISSNQTAFIKGRFILESVVTAHEVLHSTYHGNCPGLVLKLDYEKAFDKVNLDFLMEILEKRNFGPKWRKWIYQITHLGSVGVKINGLEGSFFTTGKGLRQGGYHFPSPVQFSGGCS